MRLAGRQNLLFWAWASASTRAAPAGQPTRDPASSARRRSSAGASLPDGPIRHSQAIPSKITVIAAAARKMDIRTSQPRSKFGCSPRRIDFRAMAVFHGMVTTRTHPATRWISKIQPACDQNNPATPLNARVRTVQQDDKVGKPELGESHDNCYSNIILIV